MKQYLWVAAFSVLVALFGAGLVILIASRPRGQPVQLLPPPTPAPILVHVAGAVAHPGVYTLARESRVQDALEAAGGTLPEANLDYLNLAAVLEDGVQVYVPSRLPDASPEAGTDPLSPPTRAGLAGSELLNINTATLDELIELPGIGPQLAQRIIDYRMEHGPFATIEGVMDVDGIGPGIYADIENLITIGLSP